MKQSRKIRRVWQRWLPEWMKCFARTVIKLTKISCQHTARRIRSVGHRFGNACDYVYSKLDNGIRMHTKEWIAAAFAAGLVVAPCAASAAPSGGDVVGGQVTIQQQAEVTNITQSSQRAAIDWTSFDVAKNETVNFLQPNADAALLNRVVGSSTSQIFGNMNANGHIYIVNSNGINIYDSANINVNGLHLSTADVSPAAFMSSGFSSIAAGSGNIVMSGNIKAGNVVVIDGARNITISGTIDASAAINGNGGTITIIADKTDGTLDVTGAKLFACGGSVSGDGGFVETSGKDILGLDNSVIKTSTNNGKSGTWLIDPSNFTIVSGSGAQTTTTIGADTLVSSLATNNISISTLSTGSEDGDILVNATVDYSAGTNNHDLTLSAYRNITILSGQQIKYGGTGALTLRTDNTGTGTGTLIATSANAVTLGASATAKVYYNPVTFGIETSFNITGGTSVGYMLVNTAANLAAIGNTSGWWSSNFALGAKLNMTGVTYTPIGNDTTYFTGKFDGLSNTISNLSINTTNVQYVGLFGYVSGSGAIISNLNLQNANITGYRASGISVGGVAGYNNGGTISCVTVSGGTISGSSTSGTVQVGGMAGQNNATISGATVNGGTINGSSSSGIVKIGGVCGVVSTTNNLYVTVTSGSANILSSDNFLTTATVALTGASADVTQLTGAALTLGAINVSSGAFSVTATGAVTQSGTVTADMATINAGSNDITLFNGNHFGTISTTGGIVYITEADDLVLGASTAGGYTVAAGGSVTQSGIINSTSAAIVTTSGIGASIDLSTSANVFNGGIYYSFFGTGSHDAKIRNQSLTGTAFGIVNQSGSLGSLTINTPNAGVTLGDANMSSMATLNVISGAGITQSAALTVSGAAALTAATNIDLSNYSNAIGGTTTYGFSSALAHNALLKNTVSGGGFAVSTLGGGSLSNLTLLLNTATAVTFGGTNLSAIGGNLTVVSGAVNFAGDTNVFGNATIYASGAVTQSSGKITSNSGSSNFNVCAYTNNVTISNAGNDFMVFGATGNSVTVVDVNSLVLGSVSASSFSATAAGLISQSNGAIRVSGAAVIATTGSGTSVDLLSNAGSNSFDGATTINFSGTGAHSLLVRNGGTGQIGIGTLNGSLSTLSYYAAQNLTLGGTNMTAITGNLTVDATSASVTQNGSLTVGGNASIAGGSIVLGSQTVGGNLTVNSSDAVNQVSGTSLVVAGSTNVLSRSGLGTTASAYTYHNITLANSGNDFAVFGATGAAITVNDSNAIVLGSIVDYNLGSGALSVTASGNITQLSNAQINVGKSDFSPTFTFVAKNGDTYYDITLTNTILNCANNFSGALAVTGKNVNITHSPRTGVYTGETLVISDTYVTGDYTLTYYCGANAKSIEQHAPITVGGIATISAPGVVDISYGSNDFGTLNISAYTARVADMNGLVLGNVGWSGSAMQVMTLSAGGDITQSSGSAIKLATGTISAPTGSNITLGNSGNAIGVSASSGGVAFTGNNVSLGGSNIVLGSAGTSGICDIFGTLNIHAYGSDDNTGSITQYRYSRIFMENDSAINFAAHNRVDVFSGNAEAVSGNNLGAGAITVTFDTSVSQPNLMIQNINTAASIPVVYSGTAAAQSFGNYSLQMFYRTADMTMGNITAGSLNLDNGGAILQQSGTTWAADYISLFPGYNTSLGTTAAPLQLSTKNLNIVALDSYSNPVPVCDSIYANNTSISGSAMTIGLGVYGNIEITSDSSIGADTGSVVGISSGSGKHATFTTTGSGSAIWITGANSNFETASVTYNFTGSGTHDVGYTNITANEDAAEPTLNVSGSIGQESICMPNAGGTYVVQGISGTQLSLNMASKNIVQASGTSIISQNINITGKDITLTNSGNVFNGGALTLSGRAISVKATTGDITLGTVNASGPLAINAVSGSIYEAGNAVTTMVSNSAISMTASGSIAIGSSNSMLGTGSVLAVFTGSGEHDFYFGSSTLDAPLPSISLEPTVKVHNLEIYLAGAFNHTSNYAIGNYDVTNNFSFTAPFDITQSTGTAITAPGNVSIGSNWGSIILTSIGNKLATQTDATISLRAQRNVTLTGYVGDLRLNTTTAGYYAGSGVMHEEITGNLTLAATGNITHSATAPGTRGMFVYGDASISAGGNIDLEYTPDGSLYSGLYFKKMMFSGTDVTVQSSAYIAYGTDPLKGLVLGTSTAGGALSISTDGNLSQTGVMIKNNAAAATFSSNTSDASIDLGSYANNFGSGPITFNLVSGSTGNSVSITNISNSAVLPTISTGGGSAIIETIVLPNAVVDMSGLTVNGNLSLTAGNGITQNGNAVTILSGRTLLLDVGSNTISLGNANNDFASGFLKLTGSTVNVKSSKDIILGQSSISGSGGSLIWSTAGNISETGAIVTSSASTLTLQTDKNNGSIDLGTQDNIFDGVVNFVYTGSGNLTQGYRNLSTTNLSLPGRTVTNPSASFANLTYDFAHGMILGNITLPSGGSLTLKSGGAIVQAAGTSIVMGTSATTNIIAAGQTVNLGNSGNTFRIINISSAGAITINNGTNDLTFASVTASSLGFTAGNTTITGSALTIATSNVTGTLGVNSSGAVAGGGLTVSGATTIAAGSNNVNLATANNFGGLVTVTGAAVSINNGTNNLTIASDSSYTSIDMTGADVILSSTMDTLSLAAISASGNLSVSSAVGDIIQTGAIIASGSGKTAMFSAGSGSIVLNNAANSFNKLSLIADGDAVVYGGGMSLGAITADNLTINTSGVVAQAASGTLIIAGNVLLTAPSGGAISLINAGNTIGSVGFSGTNFAVNAASNLTLANSNVTGNLSVYADGAITQSGAIVGGAVVGVVGLSGVALSGANDIGELSGVISGDLSFNDINSFNIGASGLRAGGNATLTAAGDIRQASNPSGGMVVTSGILKLSAGTDGMIDLMGGGSFTKASKNLIAKLVVLSAGSVNVGSNRDIVLGDSASGLGITVFGENVPASADALKIAAAGDITQEAPIVVTGASANTLFVTQEPTGRIEVNDANNNIDGIVALESRGYGNHDIYFANMSALADLMNLWVTSDSPTTTISNLTVNVPNRGIVTNFKGENQPGTVSVFNSITIACGGDLTQERSWYVNDSKNGTPVIILDITNGGKLYLPGSIGTGNYNQFNKIKFVRDTDYEVTTYLPSATKSGSSANLGNGILDMNL